MENLVIVLQALVAASIFFVWVVRYDNIVQEFQQYRLPAWLRDLVGILKLTCALLLLIGTWRPFLAVVGGLGLALLMGAALITHLRLRNPTLRMLPSTSLLLISFVIVGINATL